MLTAADRARLEHYSPVSFLRACRPALAAIEEERLAALAERGEIASCGSQARILYRNLAWDTEYFGVPTYRIEFASCEEAFGEPALAKVAQALREALGEIATRHPRALAFTEVPTEDLLAVQALSLAGFRLVETRLTYFRDDVQKYGSEARYPVRRATEADVPGLMAVARTMRNAFDRYHADLAFEPAVADEYLATYVRNSVAGFADVVIVPDLPGREPGAFLTGDYDDVHAAAANRRLARMVLSAVSTERRGWYLKLISELAHLFREEGVRTAYMTTQAANHAVIRVWENCGFRFGRSTHVWSATAGR